MASSAHICGEKSAFGLDSALPCFFAINRFADPVIHFVSDHTPSSPDGTARLGGLACMAARHDMRSLSRRSRRTVERRQRRISCCQWKSQSAVSTSHRHDSLLYIMFAATHSDTSTNSGTRQELIIYNYKGFKFVRVNEMSRMRTRTCTRTVSS